MYDNLLPFSNTYFPDITAYLPLFFDLKRTEDAARLQKLAHEGKVLYVHDELEGQLAEWVKLQHAGQKLGAEEIKAGVEQKLGGCSAGHYGWWVFYPWSGRLVHLLHEEEFAAVRTNRNKNKITDEEQKVLSSKKIGVIGLSVGQSVSLTMAMERSFGVLRIADFDSLELSNLNRIRTPVHHLGLPKVIIVAREIAELDPFLQVEIYPEGITPDNIDDFLTKGGHLDILIDECDGLDIKVLCRKKAKHYGIPVVMEASDRCAVDVERFDLEPHRPLLHGWIEHLDFTNFRHLSTNEARIPYLLPFVGVPTMSARLKASMLEVGHTLSTWPQLASSVVMGGGVVADVCRRIALNEFRSSGRFFVDVEQLIGDAPYPPAEAIVSSHLHGRDSGMDLPKPLPENQGTGRDFISLQLLQKIVNKAQSAHFPYNDKYHKWLFNNGLLSLIVAEKKSLAAGFSPAVIIGIMTQLLRVAAAAEQYDIKEAGPEKHDGSWIAEFEFIKSETTLHLHRMVPHSIQHIIPYIANEIEKKPLHNGAMWQEAEALLRHCCGNETSFIAHTELLKEKALQSGDIWQKILIHRQYVEEALPNQLPSSSSADLVYRLIADAKVRQLLARWNAGVAISAMYAAEAMRAVAAFEIPVSGSSFEKEYECGKQLSYFVKYLSAFGFIVKPVPVIDDAEPEYPADLRQHRLTGRVMYRTYMVHDKEDYSLDINTPKVLHKDKKS